MHLGGLGRYFWRVFASHWAGYDCFGKVDMVDIGNILGYSIACVGQEVGAVHVHNISVGRSISSSSIGIEPESSPILVSDVVSHQTVRFERLHRNRTGIGANLDVHYC